MKNNTVYIILTAIVLIFLSCKSQESIYEEYVVPNGHSYPGKVLDVVTYPGKGRIQIEWKNGSDPKVVKARISWNNDTEGIDVDIQPDIDTVRKVIEPLDENTYTFQIRTYDARGNASIPVEVTGTVYGELFESSLQNRKIKSRSFDGCNLSIEWEEADKTDLGVHLTYKDKDNEPQTIIVDSSESATELGSFNVNEPLVYYSMVKPDSLALDIFRAPLVSTMIEHPVIEIPKGNWVGHPLPDDMALNGSYPLSNFWDGNTGNFVHSVDPVTLPCTFTWDLGVTVKLSRMKLWPRNNNDDRWNRGHPRIFEIYGSLAPNPDGSLDDSWILLGRFECVQPSGNGIADPWLSPTSEDIALSNGGLGFEFVPGPSVDPSATVQYIRFRSLEHFNPTASPRILLAEVSFWGKLTCL
jgi:hypothetical protein